MLDQYNLNNIFSKNKSEQYKSEGERKIAYFFDINKIKYYYEKPILVTSIENKIRIWYPDFYLPEFKTHIEYYGYTGNTKYDQSIKFKQSVYKKNKIDIIPVYPWMFADDWKGYIVNEIGKNIKTMENKIKNIHYNKVTKPHYSKNNNLYRIHKT